MATIKSYSDLEQSRKLVEILPLESADMSYSFDFNSGRYEISTTSYKSWIVPKYAESYKGLNQVIPCWSLAALLSVLPEKYTELIKEGGMYRIIIKDSYMTCLFDNPVDACYEMIIKLHGLNLL